MTASTRYPIASTSKAVNAVLLGMLVDDGRLQWDAPVQRYLPRFRLQDLHVGSQVTVRDLITMRTGLPRHDWMWLENPMTRAELVKRLRYLECSYGLRERYQYNNLTVTASGHIAEVITGECWEDLVQTRILAPLQMSSSTVWRPISADVTSSYHENAHRELKLTQCLESQVTAPSGGAIYSTVEDMALWMSFNLNRGMAGHRRLIQESTLREIHSPQMKIEYDPTARKQNASYAIGWTVDSYGGCRRLSHGGYLDDVNSEVMLFPEQNIGIVCFVNFGPSMLALTLGEQTFDWFRGNSATSALELRLAQYEEQVSAARVRAASAPRVLGTSASQPLTRYAGLYQHPAYGIFEIRVASGQLVVHRNDLAVPLQHWHYDTWVAQDCGLFFIHLPHPFDSVAAWQFETNADGSIVALSIPLETAVAPIRFEKHD